MRNVSPDAHQRIEEYVQRIRVSLRGANVDAAEVEADVREHIAAALAEQPQPVGVEAVEAVIGRLGAPQEWAATDVPVWMHLIRSLQHGPEDWRLAYACLMFTVLGAVTLPFGGAFVLFGAYVLARATLALTAQQGSSLGPRTWLVFPILVAGAIVGGALIVAMFVAPLAALAEWGIERSGFLWLAGHQPGELDRGAEWRIIAGYMTLGAGLWWMIAGALSTLLLHPVRFLLEPFQIVPKRRSAWWPVLLGLVTAAVGAGVLLVG